MKKIILNGTRLLLLFLVAQWVCACSTTSYIDVKYRLPSDPDAIADKMVYLDLEDSRTDAAIFAGKAKEEFKHFTGIFSLTIDQVHDLFLDHVPTQSKLLRVLAAAREVGLGYLVLRQPGYALSGGEAQRLKIAKELCRPAGGRKAAERSRHTLYILDEPTLGQHLEDVARLCGVLNRLVEEGHTEIGRASCRERV